MRPRRREDEVPFLLIRLLLELSLISIFFSCPSPASALGPPRHVVRKKSLDDDEDSNRVLSRHRRFLFPSSSGWVISASFAVTIPIDSDVTGTMVFTFPFTYTVDSGTVTGGRRMGRLPRSVSSVGLPSSKPSSSPILRREEQRLTLIAGLEDWMRELHEMDKLAAVGAAGLDVHACALRVVCEVALVPHSEGLVGELLHLLLTPADVLDKLPEAYRRIDYIAAQTDGALHGDCSAHARRCPVSFFQMLDGASVGELQEEFVKLYASAAAANNNVSGNSTGSRKERE